MSKAACLLLFLLGVVIFIITPSLANQHHNKPFPGEKPPQHRPPKHHGPGGKGEEPPHGGEKPPHRHLLSVEVEDTHIPEKTHKPPHHGKPPKGKGKPPHHPH
ncbi:hypothetical protein HRI_002626300 [Hibiscus trionum]|uniref:Uncharacterized protein n=1 Tax=Hibiscus trionum TaxID=183268 RepID=A0A9W7M8P9_HIBTR|nr:hypothetical protein HRI_002626300 [Hibiscus trionum]